MMRLRLRHALALALGAFTAVPATRAQEDCLGFSTYGNCPPGPSVCTLGPAPDSCAQDCATCTPDVDDDRDCVVDEEILNGDDDDGDGLIDEDVSCLNGCDPVSYECPPSVVPPAGIDVPDPVASPLTLGARVARWSCASPDAVLPIDVEVTPDPAAPVTGCGVFRAIVRFKERGASTTYFEGPAVLVATRRWETLAAGLVGGSVGNVQVFRYTVRADLRRLTAYAQLPPELQVPCNADQTARKHLFVYGYLDLARDAARPADAAFQRRALVLGHSPGAFTHAPDSYDPAQDLCGFADVTTRGIPPLDPVSHPDEGWFVVAPGDTFTFSAGAAVPAGARSFGRIRQVASGAGQACPKETRMCESQFEDPGPVGSCPERIRYRTARLCGQDTGSPCPDFNLASLTKCAIVPGHRVAFFPVGAWSQGEFPAGMAVSLFEGGVACLMNFEPWWYGAYTSQASPALWLGPPEALDVIDNQAIRPSGSGLWLVGSVNWIDEGGPREAFAPRQFRTMYFFSSSNPDIPRLAPCAARARISPAPAAICQGQDLQLSGSGSTVVNCCQCGGLEYSWWKRVGGVWTLVQPFGPMADYVESPGPAADTEYRLDVRCTTSKNACVDSIAITVRVDAPIAVDAGPDARICAGDAAVLMASVSGAPVLPACAWSPTSGLADPAACTTLASPAVATTYTVTASAGACPPATDSVHVAVDPLPVADAGGPGPLPAPAAIGAGPCDPGLEYLWTPPSFLTPPDGCNPVADPLATTLYCLVVRDRATGCESAPDCVTVTGRRCDAAAVPPAIRQLLGVKRADDVHLEWDVEPLALGGYRVYRTEDKRDIPRSATVGFRAVTTPPGPASASGDDAGAISPVPGARYFYQVVGVCSDGESEGP